MRLFPNLKFIALSLFVVGTVACGPPPSRSLVPGDDSEKSDSSEGSESEDQQPPPSDLPITLPDREMTDEELADFMKKNGEPEVFDPTRVVNDEDEVSGTPETSTPTLPSKRNGETLPTISGKKETPWISPVLPSPEVPRAPWILPTPVSPPKSTPVPPASVPPKVVVAPSVPQKKILPPLALPPPPPPSISVESLLKTLGSATREKAVVKPEPKVVVKPETKVIAKPAPKVVVVTKPPSSPVKPKVPSTPSAKPKTVWPKEVKPAPVVVTEEDDGLETEEVMESAAYTGPKEVIFRPQSTSQFMLSETAAYFATLPTKQYLKIQHEKMGSQTKACNFFVSTAMLESNIAHKYKEVAFNAATFDTAYFIPKGWKRIQLKEAKEMFISGGAFDMVFQRDAPKGRSYGHIAIPIGLNAAGDVMVAEAVLRKIANRIRVYTNSSIQRSYKIFVRTK